MFPSKSSLLLSAILLISLLTGVQAASNQRDFVRTVGNQFQLNGHEYKAMGFTSYQLCVAKNKTSRAEVQRIFRAAKAAGFSLFRATSIVYDFNDGDLSHHLSEPVWQRMDLLLDVARQENIKVILDFSTLTYETGRSSLPPFDVTDPANFDRLKPIYQRIPNRINSINKRVYKNDPTLLGYSILGEIVPFGLRYKEDHTLDLANESRDVNNYLAFIHAAAAELKHNDPNHLVNAGGLLHVSPDGPVRDASGKPYWQTLWADPNIDFASLHIYPNLDEELKKATLPLAPPYPFTLPVGEWKNLPTYKSYADKIGKPFMVEEWGLSLDRRLPEKDAADQPGPFAYSPQFEQDYFRKSFEATIAAKIPITIIWQWYPGNSFDLYPGASKDEDAVIAIVKHSSTSFQIKPVGKHSKNMD
ncbi:MAG: cellulase family glycosylhydrolase [Acidobacteriota bacterium]|nr:cellulase family glycosylhydrolase [Acidobacteriota bacterium]